MLAAVPFFNQFAEEHGLKYKVLMLTECFMVDKEDDGTKYIQYGGAGKVMPMFFCVGHTTHGEEPFLGLDANLLNAEIYKRMHLNPAFCQQNHGVTTALPAGLKLQDLKLNYSLSSSLYAASYYNIATIKMQPEETMEKLLKLAEESFAEVNKIIDDKIAGFTDFAGKPPVAYRAQPKVKTFREIFDAAAANYDGDLTEYMKDYAAELMEINPEMQDTCVKLVKRLYEMQDDKDPMIIVAIIPPYYPDVNIDLEDADTQKMLQCIDELMKYAEEVHGEKMATSEYYGISDLCYTWLADGVNFDGLFENLVGVNMFYNFPGEAMKKFKVPALVLGAYGKDLHKYTERLNKHYNFEVLPDLYVKYIDMILK
jgi:arginine utilization protein RocB